MVGQCSCYPGSERLPANTHADFSHCASSSAPALGRSPGSNFTIDWMNSRKEVLSVAESCGLLQMRSSGDSGNVDGQWEC